MDIMQYILEEKLILIPVLYILGELIKNTELIKNKYIPIILLIVGCLMSALMGGFALIDDIIQGILVTGATVLGNQIVKQSQKEE